MATTGTLNLANGSTVTSNTGQTITANTANNGLTAWAIAPPQTIASGKLIITLADNKNKFEWNFPVNTTLEQGKNHRYYIIVSKTGITVSIGNITVWDSSGAVTEGDTAPRYAVGDYYPEANNPQTAIGLVFWLDNPVNGKSKHGTIVSLDEGGQMPWATESVNTGASSGSNGKTNMAIIKALAGWEGKYPPFKWCADKGADWYLPVQFELGSIYSAYASDTTAFNGKLTAAGGKAIAGVNYWSSTESMESIAWYTYFAYFYQATGSKEGDTFRVRAVSTF